MHVPHVENVFFFFFLQAMVFFEKSALSHAEQCAKVCTQLPSKIFMEIIHFLLHLCTGAGKQWDIVKASVFPF